MYIYNKKYIMNIKEIKQLIREEVKSSLKRMINEQDDYKIYKILDNKKRLFCYVAVKGDKIFLAQDVSKGANINVKPTNTVIGGGNVREFIEGIKQQGVKYSKSGVYSNAPKIANINNFFQNNVPSNQINDLAYGFVFDNGTPVLVAYVYNPKVKGGTDAAGEPKPLFNFSTQQFNMSPATPKIDSPKNEIPQPPTITTHPPKDFIGFFKFDSSEFTDEQAARKELMAYLNQFAETTKPLTFKVVASASIDTDNVERDQKLSQARADKVAKTLLELSLKVPKFKGKFKIERPVGIGQTDRFDPGKTYKNGYKPNQTAGNRKVIIGSPAQINAYLQKYPEKSK